MFFIHGYMGSGDDWYVNDLKNSLIDKVYKQLSFLTQRSVSQIIYRRVGFRRGASLRNSEVRQLSTGGKKIAVYF